MDAIENSRRYGNEAAREWLSQSCDVVHVGEDFVIGRRRDEVRTKAGLLVAYEDQETAVVVADEFTLGNGKARELYRRALAWKGRSEGRVVVLFFPRGTNPALLTEFSGCVVTVAYPLVSFRGAWGDPLAEPPSPTRKS